MMTQIDELQSRIARALDRIALGVDHLAPPAPLPEPAAAPLPEDAPPPPAGEDLEQLTAALDEERMANAQLEARVKLLHARLADGADAGLREQIAVQRDTMAELDGALQRLRQANDMLRRSHEDMRAALEAGVGEPHLVNQAMLAELESLRAERDAERVEARAVLGALEPLLSGAESPALQGAAEETQT
jgi:chromosome segregation ATPase|tara:strand:+ start:54 stop:620 length:567 start_codon:yes stop_codon:yes gene_type:complete